MKTRIVRPYLLFLGDAADDLEAKTAIGVRHWRPADCIGQLRLPGCVPRLDLPEMTVTEAAAGGARTLLIGVANRGGIIPGHWNGVLADALAAGLDIASGLHARVGDIAAVRDAAAKHGRAIHEVRHPTGNLQVADGTARGGRRLLTVGTDCSVGKMYTSLALESAMRKRGIDCEFCATGQTGILIAGGGISVDAVPADFIAGAVEELAPAAPPGHWHIIEGQGSLFHPSYAGVSLGLLHGAQPDTLVLCHEPARPHMRGLPHQPMPALEHCIAANILAAKVVSSKVHLAGIALNTAALDEAEAARLLAATADEHGMPCVDPVRGGVDAIVDNIRF